MHTQQPHTYTHVTGGGCSIDFNLQNGSNPKCVVQGLGCLGLGFCVCECFAVNENGLQVFDAMKCLTHSSCFDVFYDFDLIFDNSYKP